MLTGLLTCHACKSSVVLLQCLVMQCCRAEPAWMKPAKHVRVGTLVRAHPLHVRVVFLFLTNKVDALPARQSWQRRRARMCARWRGSISFRTRWMPLVRCAAVSAAQQVSVQGPMSVAGGKHQFQVDVAHGASLLSTPPLSAIAVCTHPRSCHHHACAAACRSLAFALILWVGGEHSNSCFLHHPMPVASPVLSKQWQAGTYGARLERVVAARAAVEQRLHKRLDLLDGYARVVNMVEIEARPCDLALHLTL